MASIIEMISSGWFVGTLSALLFVLGVVVGRSSRGVAWSLAEVRHIIEMLVQEAEQTIRPVQEWVAPDPRRQIVDSQSDYDYAEHDDYDLDE